MLLSKSLSGAACLRSAPTCFASTTRVVRVAPSCQQRGISRLTIQRAAPVEEDCDYIATEMCALDPKTGERAAMRSVGEMEQEFLAALSSYYNDGKAIISDEEFELLKEELIWSGSKVAIMDTEEQQFLEASIASSQGKPIMSDAEYDQLKAALRTKGSVVAAEGPRCSIRSKKMYSNAVTDYLRLTALNVPAVLLVLGFVFAIDDITGFEITEAIELPPPYGVALLWGLLLPTCFVIASSITNIFFKNAQVLKGPCPNCGEENFTFFGDVMTVSGNRGQNLVDCVKCNASLTFDENKRIIVVGETPEERAKKAPPAGAKKAGAKKKAAAAEE